MDIVFDAGKDAINRAKHGIALSRTKDFDFEAAYLRVDDREDYREVRYRAISFLDAQLFVLVFTMAGMAVRPISLRKATRHEEYEYAQEQ